MQETPIVEIVSPESKNYIYCKRDDLIPFSFGGNKVRIASEYFADMLEKKTCIVGYGNARSNLSRVIANMASAKQIPCHIISPTDTDGRRVETFNSTIVQKCGAVFHYCNKENVPQTIETVLAECRKRGLDPYYINGDCFGKGNEEVPVRAYARVYKEIQEQSRQMGIEFDYVFLATGTGMTQAGLLAGQCGVGGKEKIVGISIARKADIARREILRYLNAFLTCNNMQPSDENCVKIVDDYLCGGYGKYDLRIRNAIDQMLLDNGIPVDPTYVGKAYWGMQEYLKKEGITKKNILFIHTGGTPLFFDYLANGNEIPVMRCDDSEKTLDFLRNIDNTLPTSLGSRVSLEEYAQKVHNNGVVLGIESEGRLVSATLFYCNDQESRNAYLTLLGTLPGYEGRGFANALIEAMLKEVRLAGMERIYLDTERTNTRAIALYKKWGFVICGITPKIHMVKELY